MLSCQKVKIPLNPIQSHYPLVDNIANWKIPAVNGGFNENCPLVMTNIENWNITVDFSIEHSDFP